MSPMQERNELFMFYREGCIYLNNSFRWPIFPFFQIFFKVVRSFCHLYFVSFNLLLFPNQYCNPCDLFISFFSTFMFQSPQKKYSNSISSQYLMKCKIVNVFYYSITYVFYHYESQCCHISIFSLQYRYFIMKSYFKTVPCNNSTALL